MSGENEMMVQHKISFRAAAAVLLAVGGVIFLAVSCAGEKGLPVLAYQDRIADASAILAAEELEENDLFTVMRFSSGSLTAEALITGSADFATMGDAAAVNIASRYPDRIVLLWVHGDGYDRHRLVSRNIPPEKIGVKFGTSTHAALIAWLQNSFPEMYGDMQPQLIDMAPDLQLSALDSGEIDALAASEPTPTIALGKLSDTAAVSLIVEGRQYPVVLVSTRKALEKYPEAAQILFDALMVSSIRVNHAVSNADAEAMETLVDVTGLDNSGLAYSLTHHRFGVFPVDEYLEEMGTLAGFMLESGSISVVPVWSDVVR